MTVISIVTGALGMVSKSLVRRLKDLEFGGRAETNQMTTLQRTTGILR